jgi:hypothetical protein
MTCFPSPQAISSMAVGRILQLNSASSAAKDSTSCAGDGVLISIPVAVSITRTSDSLVVSATTKSSLNISSLLDKMWPARPPVLSSFVSSITMPPMTVSYSSTKPKRTFTLVPATQETDTQFLSLGNVLSISAPTVTYQEDPHAFSMALNAKPSP